LAKLQGCRTENFKSNYSYPGQAIHANKANLKFPQELHMHKPSTKSSTSAILPKALQAHVVSWWVTVAKNKLEWNTKIQDWWKLQKMYNFNPWKTWTQISQCEINVSN